MEAGTLVAWKVRPGDHVERGAVVAEVETDKGTVEVEIFEAGTVDRILVEPGQRVPVGTVLALLRNGAGGPPAAPPPPPAPAAAGQRARVSPVARRLADTLGIDLGALRGSGPGGAIERADVERAAAARAGAAEAPAPAEAPAGFRRAIAAAMARSNREIPHYYLQARVDMSRPLRRLEQVNQRRPPRERLLPAVLLIRAVARALGDVPELNGYWIDGRHQIAPDIHIGFAIAQRNGGLIVPAIRHADRQSLDQLMASLRDLIGRVRGGRLRSSELTDATVTVTSLGDLGVETVYGVIYPPQVALVGFGAISEQPWAAGGRLDARPVLTATLAGDHRATDGRRGAQFLESLARHLQEEDKP